MKKIELKTFDFSNVNGLSNEQLTEHYKLYEGYVKKTNELWTKFSEQKDFGKPSPSDSNMRKNLLAESYAVDGAKLHTYYFENLNNLHPECDGSIAEKINCDFDSYDNFIKRLKDVAMSVRGWAILAYDTWSDTLHVYGQDEHDKGVVIDSVPLLVLDVYEHAYFKDYGIDKNKYLDVFTKNINWDVVNKRYEYVMSLYNVSSY